eukprot:29988-Pelagococcus_subviridis.AAC.1
MRRRVGTSTVRDASAPESSSSAAAVSASAPFPSPDATPTPTRTTASDGARLDIRKTPSSKSPRSTPSASAAAGRCDGYMNRRVELELLGFESTPPPSAPPHRISAAMAAAASSAATRADSYISDVAASSPWNRGKYSPAVSTSTPGGAIRRPSRNAARSSASSSLRTTTGNAPRTFAAYHAAARRTGWSSAPPTPPSSSSSSASPPWTSRRRVRRLTAVARQCSFANSTLLRRRSPHIRRSRRLARAFPRSCAFFISDARNTTLVPVSGSFHTKRRRGGVERRQMELKGAEVCGD